MYGAGQENKVWRRRYNLELYHLYKRSGSRDMVITITIGYDKSVPTKQTFDVISTGNRQRKIKAQMKQGGS